MRRRCEVCAETAVATRATRRVLVEKRVIALCDEHASALGRSEPRTLMLVRALFRESTGRRSLLSRRAPLDRRVFPARPEGRRASNGRRATD